MPRSSGLPVSSTADGNASTGTGGGVEISALAFSPDGQWLATTDDCCRTHVFNLDAIQVRRALLPADEAV